MAAGMAVAALGYVLLTQVDAATPALLVAGWTVALGGAGLPAGLAIGLIIGAAPAEKAGSASSLSETCTEFGLALGIATIGSLATAVYRGGLDLPPGTPPDAAAATADGITGALAAAARAPEVLAPARDAYTAVPAGPRVRPENGWHAGRGRGRFASVTDTRLAPGTCPERRVQDVECPERVVQGR